MFDKLKMVEKRYNDLNDLLSDPKIIAQQSEFQKYAKGTIRFDANCK